PAASSLSPSFSAICSLLKPELLEVVASSWSSCESSGFTTGFLWWTLDFGFSPGVGGPSASVRSTLTFGSLGAGFGGVTGFSVSWAGASNFNNGFRVAGLGGVTLGG